MFRTTLDKLIAIRDEKKAQDGGFTLIELLVVVVIIGILIAIAIPLYLNYEKGANDKAAASDLRAAISDVNNCYSANSNTYPASGGVSSGQFVYTMPAVGNAAAATCTTKSNLSGGTTLTYSLDSDSNGFYMTSTNSNGSGATYYYNSEKGSGVSTTNPGS